MSKYLKYLLIFLLAVIPFLFIDRLLFLKDPPVWPDEAIFAEMAANLLQTGTLSTNLFGAAVPGLHQHALWYPPLYFYVLAGWIKFFGQSIEMVRLLSGIAAFFALAGFFTLAKIMFRRLSLAFWGTVFLSADISFQQAARVGRMDMLNFLFLILGLVCFALARNERPKLYLCTGLFAGLGILTHPYGLILPAVIFLYIIFEKITPAQKMRHAAYIIIPVAVAFLAWFAWINGRIGLFIAQYGLQFARKSLEIPSQIVLAKHPFWIAVYAGYIICILVAAVTLIKRHRDIGPFIFTGIAISVIVSLWGKEFWFMLYFQPFASLVILWLLAVFGKKGQKLFPAVAAISAMILFLNILYLANTYNLTRGDAFSYHRFTSLLARNLPTKGKIFLAVIPDPYFDLRKNKKFSFYEFPTVPVNYEEYKALLDDSDYIIVNMAENQLVSDYSADFAKRAVIVRQPGGYSAEIAELADKDKRK